MGLNHSPLIVTDGLRQYLDAGNVKSYPGTGTAWNDIVGGFNGTLSTPAYSDEAGGSFSFNGTSDRVSCGNLGSFTTEGTISLWFNSASVANYRTLFCTKFDGLNSGIRIEQQGSGALVGYAGDDDVNVSGALSFGSITAGAWYKVDIAWSTASNKISGYLNGVQAFSTSNTHWPASIPSLTVGVGYLSSLSYRWFQGSIAQLMVYDRALVSEETLTNYNSMIARFVL